MEEGLGAHFVDESGRPVLAYDGLKVFDAFGAQLPARLLVTDDRLQFVIDDRTAVYPITIDPTAQRAYIKASNTGTEDIFGYAVAISGDTMVVGAPSERSASTGVDGDQTDDSATYAGAAYVFVRRAGVWTQEAYLKPSNTVAGSMSGFSRHIR
ncbi:MAG: FG-GAP repeat protein [Uliginosibacterium sp.]|nr:FG-GAP repeat protein [Uliginosibacterium sp.]